MPLKMADITVLDDRGRTPLHVACYRGYTKVVNCLLEFEADTTIRSAS